MIVEAYRYVTPAYGRKIFAVRHGELYQIHPEQHHQETGTAGEIIAVCISSPLNSPVDYTNTTWAYVDQFFTYMPYDTALTGTEIVLRIIANLRHYTAGETAYATLAHHDGTAWVEIPGTTVSVTGTTWGAPDSGWIPYTPPYAIGYQPLGLGVYVSAGTGRMGLATTIMLGHRII